MSAPCQEFRKHSRPGFRQPSRKGFDAGAVSKRRADDADAVLRVEQHQGPCVCWLLSTCFCSGDRRCLRLRSMQCA